jgi:hypothetical protein
MNPETNEKRVRLSNDQRARVRGSLAAYLCKMGLDQEKAVAAVCAGSPAMFEQVARTIARGRHFRETREVTPDAFNLAFAEWIARKAGVRDDAQQGAQDDAQPAPAAAPVFRECSAEAPAVRDLFAI